MAKPEHVLAERRLEDRRVQLVAEAVFTRAVVRVTREHRQVQLAERDVMLVLRKAGVEVTPDVEARVASGVKLVNDSPVLETLFVVAEGAAPIPGTDAELVWAVDTASSRRHHADEDGPADFRRLHDTLNVLAGQLLLTVKPPTRGRPGRDIFGDAVHARNGREADVRCGRSVRVSDEGLQYSAQENGRLSFRYGVLSVENVYEVHGNVDYASGNIEFAGPVIVHGDVLAGFEIRSGEWVQVFGTVEAASITAKEDVEIRGGVNGRGRARIACGGALSARYLNGVKVEAGGDVEVVKSVVHSDVRCGGKFRVITQGVRGGSVVAGGDVDIPVIGSARGVTVEVCAGMDVKRAQGLERLEETIERLTRERQRLRQDLGGLVDEPARVVELRSVEKRVRMAGLLRRYFDVERELSDLDFMRVELAERVRESEGARIRVARTLWRGVVLRIGAAEHVVRRDRRGPIEFIARQNAIVAV